MRFESSEGFHGERETRTDNMINRMRLNVNSMSMGIITSGLVELLGTTSALTPAVIGAFIIVVVATMAAPLFPPFATFQ